MSTKYTELLMNEIERVGMRGSADRDTIRVLSSILFEMDKRLSTLEGQTATPDKPQAKPQAAAPVRDESFPAVEPAPVVQDTGAKTVSPPKGNQKKGGAAKK